MSRKLQNRPVSLYLLPYGWNLFGLTSVGHSRQATASASKCHERIQGWRVLTKLSKTCRVSNHNEIPWNAKAFCRNANASVLIECVQCVQYTGDGRAIPRGRSTSWSIGEEYGNEMQRRLGFFWICLRRFGGYYNFQLIIPKRLI